MRSGREFIESAAATKTGTRQGADGAIADAALPVRFDQGSVLSDFLTSVENVFPSWRSQLIDHVITPRNVG